MRHLQKNHYIEIYFHFRARGVGEVTVGFVLTWGMKPL